LSDMSHLRLSEQQLTWLLGGYDVIGHSTLNYTSMGL
jgi:transposase